MNKSWKIYVLINNMTKLSLPVIDIINDYFGDPLIYIVAEIEHRKTFIYAYLDKKQAFNKIIELYNEHLEHCGYCECECKICLDNCEYCAENSEPGSDHECMYEECIRPNSDSNNEIHYSCYSEFYNDNLQLHLEITDCALRID